MNLDRYNNISLYTSKKITRQYSTSFSIGTAMFPREIRDDIYKIYGFVRVADEIVDTFNDKYPKQSLLEKFREDTFQAIENGISTNFVLNSFQQVVNKYQIDYDQIDAFLESMAMDLTHQTYDVEKYKKYIYGSAEVVGLMCLKVFLNDQKEYNRLKPYAQYLGAAFQKVNFLRDLNQDYTDLKRIYFPDISYDSFSEKEKEKIIDEIKYDFEQALVGIKQLPGRVKLAVYIAYIYYLELLKKINKTPVTKLMQRRVRINNSRKYQLLGKAYVSYKLNML